MKKITSFLLALLLALSLIGCGADRKPETVVATFCDTLKSFDTDATFTCFESGSAGIEDPYSEDEEIKEDLSSKEVLVYLKSCAAKMTYTIGESKIDGETAEVPVTFTYVDASPVVTAALGEYIPQALGLAFSGADDAGMKGLFGTIFMEKSESVETSTATATATINCIKVDKEWKIKDLDDDTETTISNMLTCNIASAFDGFNDDGSKDDTVPEDLEWHDVVRGQELELATVKICVTGCEELTELTAEYYEPDVAKDGTKYVVFTVDIENITKDTLNFHNDLKLMDSQGRTYQPYSNAMWYYDQTFSYTDLAPDIKESGNFIYNVPTDSESYYLTVQKANTNDGYRLYAK